MSAVMENFHTPTMYVCVLSVGILCYCINPIVHQLGSLTEIGCTLWICMLVRQVLSRVWSILLHKSTSENPTPKITVVDSITEIASFMSLSFATLFKNTLYKQNFFREFYDCFGIILTICSTTLLLKKTTRKDLALLVICLVVLRVIWGTFIVYGLIRAGISLISIVNRTLEFSIPLTLGLFMLIYCIREYKNHMMPSPPVDQ